MHTRTWLATALVLVATLSVLSMTLASDEPSAKASNATSAHGNRLPAAERRAAGLPQADLTNRCPRIRFPYSTHHLAHVLVVNHNLPRPGQPDGRTAAVLSGGPGRVSFDLSGGDAGAISQLCSA